MDALPSGVPYVGQVAAAMVGAAGAELRATGRLLPGLLGAALAIGVPARVAAQAPAGQAEGQMSEPEKRAAARALFDESRKLAGAQSFAEACPKLAESYRLDPTMGTKFYREHTVSAAAPGKKSWEARVTVRAEGERVTVQVPALDGDAPRQAAAPRPEPSHALTPAGLGARAVFHKEFHKYELAIEDIAANRNFNVAPRIVALQGATPQLLVVYVQSGTSQFGYRVWANSGWLIGAMNLGTTPARPALAALPDGRAILAYQGTNNRLYYAFHAPMGWSVPAEVSSVTEQLLAPPAVATGVGDAVVDLAYVTTGGLVRHVRYQDDAWSDPVDIGTFPGITHLALASAPPQP